MNYQSLKPFVKWAGGKTQLLNTLKEKIPQKYNTYYEPFIGGGALLLSIKPKNAVISDTNSQLINIYKQLKKNPQLIIEKINKLDCSECNKETYIERRCTFNSQVKENILNAETAALMIWLNKHCFNGLYRVNSKGEFNVPFNNSKSQNSINSENLLNISRYLNENQVSILNTDFENTCNSVSEGDFVYFDSPYIKTYDGYTSNKFTENDHLRLAKLFKYLDSKGALLMLSNSAVGAVYNLYSKYNICEIDVRRNINANSQRRTGKEVIITNY